MLAAVLGLCFGACVVAQNLEVRNRVIDYTSARLDQMEFPVKQMSEMFRVGAPTSVADVQKLLFTQSSALPDTTFSVLFSYLNGTTLVFTNPTSTNNSNTSSCTTSNSLEYQSYDATNNCSFDFFTTTTNDECLAVDNQAQNIHNCTTISLLSNVSTETQNTSEIAWHSSIIGQGILAQQYAQNLTGVFGFVGVWWNAASLQSFLQQEFSEDTIVVITATNTTDIFSEQIIASSISQCADSSTLRDLSSCSKTCATGLKLWAEYLDRGYAAISDGDILILRTSHILPSGCSGKYCVELTFTIIEPASKTYDVVEIGSLLFVLLVALGCTGILSSIGFFAWVWRFKNLRLWRMAQMQMILLLLSSHCLCNIVILVLLIPPTTDSSCLARAWLFPLSLTITFAVHISKIHRVFQITQLTKSFQARRVTLHHATSRVLVFVVGELTILAVWTSVNPARTATSITLSDSSLATIHQLCYFPVWGEVLSLGIPVALVIFGCSLCFVARNMYENLGDSRALSFVFYHAFVLGAVVVGVLFGTVADEYTRVGTLGVSLWWFTMSSQVAFVLRRVGRQILVGDLKKSDVNLSQGWANWGK